VNSELGRLRVDGYEEAFLRTGEQPVNDSLVPRSRTPDEATVPAIYAPDVKLLPRFDTVNLTELGRETDPALVGKRHIRDLH
jgi:hypothetical protein